MLTFSYEQMVDMKISKQFQKLKNLNVKAENCLSREEAKKIIKICTNYSYGKLKIINLFALITRNPDKLLIHKKPVGYLNNRFINENLKYWSENNNCDLWMGWGNNGTFFKRNQKISKKIMNFYATKKNNFVNPLGPLFIKKTKKENPIHPLYCSDNSTLQAASFERDLIDAKV